MINLIPPSAKRNLKFEYWVRVASVWLLIWSVVLIISAGLLFPAYVLIGSKINIFQESAAIASEKVNTYENVSKTLVQSSQQARFAIEELSLPSISGYIDLLKGIEGSDIRVDRALIRRDGQGIAPVLLSGQAVDRQALAEYRDRLVLLDQVLEVDLPISNLTQDRDIDFNLTVTINNNAEL